MSPIRKLEVGPNMVVYYTDGPAGPGRPGTTLPGLPTGLEAAVRVLGLKMPSDPPSAPKLATPGMFSRTKEQAAQIELSPKGDLADPPYMPECVPLFRRGPALELLADLLVCLFAGLPTVS